MIETPRLRLRPWRDDDRDAFAAMHADPAVMVDTRGLLTREQADRKMDRYRAAYDQHGFCRWALETHDGAFVGYTGVMPSRDGNPLGPHYEIGWRLARAAWSHGYATEAARAALADIFARTDLTEVLSYTAPDNARSQAVMARLNLERVPPLDFTTDDEGVPWSGLVWRARRPNTQAS